MASENHFAEWDDLDPREIESVTYRQVEGAVAFVAVLAAFAAAVILFWT
jgi:hypothetical protein